MGCCKCLSLRAQVNLHWDSLESGINRQQSKAQSALVMNCEVLGNKSLVRKVVVLLKNPGWNWTRPCLVHQEKMTSLTLRSPKPHLLLIVWGWKSNLPIRTALICSGSVSSPVSFSVMDANDIFLSNFSSLDTDSVSDLGGELREFGTRACRQDWDQILRRSRGGLNQEHDCPALGAARWMPLSLQVHWWVLYSVPCASVRPGFKPSFFS